MVIGLIVAAVGFGEREKEVHVADHPVGAVMALGLNAAPAQNVLVLCDGQGLANDECQLFGVFAPGFLHSVFLVDG